MYLRSLLFCNYFKRSCILRRGQNRGVIFGANEMKLTKVEEDQLMANWKPEPLVPPDLGNLLNFITKKMSIHIGLIFLKKITLTVDS